VFFLTAEVEFTDDDSVPGVDIAVPGAPDIPEANLEEGYMTMSRYQEHSLLYFRFCLLSSFGSNKGPNTPRQR